MELGYLCEDIQSMRKLRNNELGRLNVEEYKSSDKTPVIVILDEIRSLHNVGSIFRTADAFRLEAIYLCGITATPPHPEIEKTALGASDVVPWKYFETAEAAIEQVRTKEWSVFAIEQTTERIWLQNFEVPKGLAIIMGNEVKGVRSELLPHCDGCIEIPQIGTKHSLNVSVSAGIVLWEIVKQLRF